MFKLLKINEAKEALGEMEVRVSAYKEEVLNLESELQASKDFSGDLQGQLVEKDIEIAELKNELEEAEANIEEVEASSLNASEAAADIVATCGADEPVEVESKAEVSNDELWSKYNELTDSASKVEFYRKHRNKLLKRN